MSITYQIRMARWHERTNERRIHLVSKELYTEIKQGTLDELTTLTFK